jgi:hypothetical protein
VHTPALAFAQAVFLRRQTFSWALPNLLLARILFLCEQNAPGKTPHGRNLPSGRTLPAVLLIGRTGEVLKGYKVQWGKNPILGICASIGQNQL